MPELITVCTGCVLLTLLLLMFYIALQGERRSHRSRSRSHDRHKGRSRGSRRDREDAKAAGQERSSRRSRRRSTSPDASGAAAAAGATAASEGVDRCSMVLASRCCLLWVLVQVRCELKCVGMRGRGSAGYVVFMVMLHQKARRCVRLVRLCTNGCVTTSGMGQGWGGQWGMFWAGGCTNDGDSCSTSAAMSLPLAPEVIAVTWKLPVSVQQHNVLHR
jgi:hypothetical protein